MGPVVVQVGGGVTVHDFPVPTPVERIKRLVKDAAAAFARGDYETSYDLSGEAPDLMDEEGWE